MPELVRPGRAFQKLKAIVLLAGYLEESAVEKKHSAQVSASWIVQLALFIAIISATFSHEGSRARRNWGSEWCGHGSHIGCDSRRKSHAEES